MILDEGFLNRLEMLRLAIRRRVRGRREGEREAPRRGGSSVFHSFRPYAQGDDFRAIDWCLYARLGALFIRERTREEAPRLEVIMDTSPSMVYGTPSKEQVARQLAAVLGYLTLGEGGEVTLRAGANERSFEGEGLISAFFAAVETLRSEASPAEAVRRVRGKPMVVLISDLWDESVRAALAALAADATGVSLIHVLAREELETPVRGWVRVVDCETRASVARYVGDEEILEYGRRLEAHCGSWREWAVRREVGYLRCASDEPFERVVFLYLRGEGLLE
ncbi:MAG: DUF58 domain-containing protein [Planctomycetes bacterium]|nr:DUF58 domain-containing protein [Planctomycetota bacterium]